MTADTTTPADETPELDAPPVVRDELARRLDGLVEVIDTGRGRLDDDVLLPAADLAARAGERLKLSGEHTIVALAGATGSGKSSLFNALTDLELAGVGVRRPTTSWALACAWGPEGSSELLEWLGIPARHQVSRTGMLESVDDGPSMRGLVLLDLPDHDSTEVSHHVEMDRLVRYADTLIWVLDPQKYADAAIHERYIRPMAGYGDVTLVVLNQIDRIPYERRAEAIADVKRLLAVDGLPDVKVLGVSATRGDGMDELRQEIADRIAAKNAAKNRLLADIGEAAGDIAKVGGSVQVPDVTTEVLERFDAELADCAGVPQIVDAIRTSTRRRAARRTGWPIWRWLVGRRQSDTLGLGEDFSTAAVAAAAVPEVGQVQQANADLAIRDAVDRISLGLKLPWRNAVRRAAQTGGRTIAPALNQAIRDTDLRLNRVPVWWRLVQLLQWLLLLALVAGIVWSIAVAVERLADVDLSLPDLGEVASVPNSVWGALGAALAGILLGLVSRLLARRGGRRRARLADRRLREAIASVASEAVVTPVEAELDQYRRYRTGLLDAMD